jgi:hypothetical protein
MEPRPRHQIAESKFRQLIRNAGLAEPDRVEYDAEELTFYWDESKLAVIVEIDDPCPRAARPA